jgi:hypothetical protein
MTAIGQTAVTARQSLTDRNSCIDVVNFDPIIPKAAHHYEVIRAALEQISQHCLTTITLAG